MQLSEISLKLADGCPNPIKLTSRFSNISPQAKSRSLFFHALLIIGSFLLVGLVSACNLVGVLNFITNLLSIQILAGSICLSRWIAIDIPTSYRVVESCRRRQSSIVGHLSHRLHPALDRF